MKQMAQIAAKTDPNTGKHTRWQVSSKTPGSAQKTCQRDLTGFRNLSGVKLSESL